VKIPEPIVTVTRYIVTCVPPDAAPDAHVWAYTVEQGRDGRWTAGRSGRWLTADGTRVAACSESYEVCAHDLETALRLAREEAPRVRVGRRSVADALADMERWREEEADRGC
jgi:hypothetical protein